MPRNRPGRLKPALPGLLLVLFLSACAAPREAQRPVAAVQPVIAPTAGLDWRQGAQRGALLAAMAYGSAPDQDEAELGDCAGLCAGAPDLSVQRRLDRFAAAGLHARYHASRGTWRWFAYPELYVLGNVPDQSLVIVVVGTNDGYDWYENAKTAIYEDAGRAGDPYIPNGHAGFRRGVANLIDDGLIDALLPDLCRRWGIRPGADGRIPVEVAGHSQGAGIAQLLLPAIDGWCHTGEVRADGTRELVRCNALFQVRNAWLIAPPYAIASDRFRDPDADPERQRRDRATWGWMSLRYGARMWNVIHEADLVPVVYDLRHIHEVSLKHVGRCIRIDGGGQARLLDTGWDNLRPHDQWSYVRRLRTLEAPAAPPAGGAGR